MPLITLMTDFGLRDGYPGVMKGVIYRIAPNTQIADITHAIRPQNVREGSLVWARSCPFFPDGAVHIGVVDPGVGTQRRPIAARIGENYYVCPDNGLLSPLLDAAEQQGAKVEIVHLDQPRFWLPQTSTVFHGRDVFAPVAAHLASGVSLAELGTPIHDPIRLAFPQPEKIENGWRGEVISIDHFGNAGTNISREHIGRRKDIRLRVAGNEIRGLSITFGDHAPGELVAVIDSDDALAVAVVNGDAAAEVGIEIGAVVEVTFS